MNSASRKNHMSLNRVIRIVIGIVAALLVVVLEAPAQTQLKQGFIYGRVHTTGSVYTGVLRWGTEEILWTDHFNATKPQSDYYQKAEKESTDWFNLDWRLSSIWENKGTTFQFISQFGDMKEISISRDDDVRVTFKNGVEIKLRGGSNDVGATIHVFDDELGEIDVSWSRIRRVEFMSAPSNLAIDELPLYGTVETARKGSFTGYVVWDNDERIGSDKLNGSSVDGRMTLPFSEISSIEQRNEGSQVVLKSGREFYLTGSNDVDEDNRGVFVVVPGVGTIEVPWRAFRKLTFERPRDNPVGYASFPTPKMLSGKVLTHDDKEFTGNIIYDMDETWEFEMLEGNDDELKYYIPFRNIKSVKPKNFDYSMIGLRNGESLLLGGIRDVSSDNDGILVIKNRNDQPEYISWRKVNEIIFN
jgi:hypothetical protein